MGKLDGKVALVTSGTRGIGLQSVKTLAENGAIVYIGARRLDAAQEICDELAKSNYKAKAVYFDATKEETYKTMVEEVVNDAGKIDILVNNYGGTDARKDSNLVDGDQETFFETLNNNVIISIKDNGIGIPDEDREFIFERFYRTDKSRDKETGGIGIGLTISKSIVNAHNGEIFVNSKLNEGTEFIIKLPKL